MIRQIRSTITPTARTPPPIKRGIVIPFEGALSDVPDVTSWLPEVFSSRISLLDEVPEELLPDVVPEELFSVEDPDGLLSDEVPEELLSDEDPDELLSEEVSEELSSDNDPDELLSGEDPPLSDELFISLDVSCGSYRSVLDSVALHTEHILVSRPSLSAVGAFVVFQSPKEC